MRGQITRDKRARGRGNRSKVLTGISVGPTECLTVCLPLSMSVGLTVGGLCAFRRRSKGIGLVSFALLLSS